jgi:hypothetical protein
MKPKNNKSLALVLQIIFSKCWSQINIFVCIQHFCLCPSHFLIFHLAAKFRTRVCVRVRSQCTQDIFPIAWPAVWWGQAPALSSPGGSSQSTGAGGARSPGSRSPGRELGPQQRGRWTVPRPLNQWYQNVFKERATFKMHKWTYIEEIHLASSWNTNRHSSFYIF